VETWKLSYYEVRVKSRTKIIENLIGKILNQKRVLNSESNVSIYIKENYG
jgi:hypothetical protein